MKNIHTILLSFAASLLLVPVASAQTDHEKYTLDNGVGGNKYVVNTYPNDDGEYTLRLEAFITGGVSASAVPTDFVLVLDASGSMFYDYRPASASTPMNDTGSSWATLWPYFMHEPGNEYTAFSIYYTYKNGSVGSAGSGSPRSTTNHVATRSYYSHFTDEAATTNCSLYYHYVDPANPGNDGYY